ncbi:MAG: MBOAT family protein [Phycisphaerales bacterium]|jgi:alginate O-acetyltransferase complex protein AlgI|nr:MBOAT family protein [Phycisphaerales bacterium]
MLFHSFAFVSLFAITFAVYWAVKEHRLRMGVVVIASIVFYATWNPWLIFVLLGSTSVDFFIALKLEKTPSARRRKVLMIVSIAINLGILAFFKYGNFLIHSADSVFSMLGIPLAAPAYGIILPLGISFYTFEAISYIVEVYQGKTKAVRDWLDYLLYILFFPHLIAGPIVRPHHFLPQIKQKKTFDFDRLQFGAQLFMMGLIKKAVIADNLSIIVDPVFATPGQYGSTAIWLAVLGYSAQIYCDFSGYTDMAIGVAHTLGFKLPNNFNMPYFASNIAEFWGRWHISLSTWLRDYLYIPLGGNRQGKWKTYRNLMITMVLGGLWHGAAWTFVAWGFYHGLLLVIHRAWRKSKRRIAGLVPLSVAFTFLCTCVGWVLFRAQTFSDAWLIIKRMFKPFEGKALTANEVRITLTALGVLLVAHLIGTFVNIKKIERRLAAPILGAGLAAALVIAQLLSPEDVKAFIYFQF